MSAQQTALALAEEFGLPVFPCNASKEPYTEHGFKDASTNIEQISQWWERWPDALVGVPTGAASGVLVVDIDSNEKDAHKTDGRPWYIAHEDQLGAHRFHRSANGGYHLLYAMPGVDIRCGTSKIAPGVDVKANGGYVIWWPATGRYAAGPEINELDEPPPWLLELMREPKKPQPAPATNGAGRIPEGKRNATLTSLAGSMRKRGCEFDAINAALAAHNSAHCDPPLPASDVRRIAESVCRYQPEAEAEDPLEHVRIAIVADLEAGPEAIDKAQPPRWISYPRLPVAGSVLAAPGSTGKTTLVLGEKVRITTGLDFYGDPIDAPGICVYVSAEDGASYPRYLLQRIIADGVDANALTAAQAALAKGAVRIVGWSRTKYGPIMGADEAGNSYVRPVWALLLELLAPLKPVYVTLDPSVLFGPGERLGNDAAAAFAALMHETAQQIGACVQTVDHVAQSVARNNIVDQYASRGGTGKVDESRLARQLVSVNPDMTKDAPLPFGVTADDVSKGRILQLHWTKPSYAPRPAAAWLRRTGYWFSHLRAPNADEAVEHRKGDAAQQIARAELAVLDYVRTRCAAGEKLGKREIARSTITALDDGRKITAREADEAIRTLLTAGKLVRRDLPAEDRTGFRKDYIDAA